MSPKPIQLFGTIEVPAGRAAAMICIDSDRPHEYMVHTWGHDNPVALMFDATMDSLGSISLTFRSLYRPAENGALYPPRLNDAEMRLLHAISAQLHWTAGGLRGQWTGQDAIARSIEFVSPPQARR